MSGRDTVLNRIRAALSDVPDNEVPGDVQVPRGYLTTHAGDDAVGLFAERAAAYGTAALRTGPADAGTAIADILHRRGVTSLVVPPGFPDGLLPDGGWIRLGDRPPLVVGLLEAADAVITTAAAAIAVTGTIVLDAGPGQGRRALSLLPDYHLCVVRAEQIAGDVPQALRCVDPRAPLTFISGPSATSDIELERIEGVHGPRTLDIVIVDRSASEEPL